MKELKDKIIGYATFTVVFFLHIYFALLLGTKPALAQDSATPAPAPTKVEKVVKGDAAKAAPAPAAKLDVPPPLPPKPPKVPKISDTEINIKIDPKEGLSIKGIDKMVEKLEAIDRAHNDEDGDQDVTIDENGIQIKKRVHIRDDEGEEDGGGRYYRRHDRSLQQILIPLMGILFVMSSLLGYMYFQYKSRRDSLDTIKMFIEKGQPIPPELMTTLKGDRANVSEWDGYQSHLLKGLKPIFWGLGIVLFFIFNELDITEWFFGMIFILIGAYHITRSHLIQKEKEKNPPPVAPVVDETTVKVEAPKN